MAQVEQKFANHRRYVPLFHFVALPLLLINVVARGMHAFREPTGWAWWEFAVAFAVAAFAVAARNMVLVVQNRLIRLEERLRLARVIPVAMQGDIEMLTASQLIGLRFASDAELPDLVRRCRAGELSKADEVKRQVREWRPDVLRA